MRNGLIAVAVVAGSLAACHRQPQPTYEYGETVTYTSTAADPQPPSTAGSAAPAAPSSTATSAPSESAPTAAGPAPATIVERDGDWTVTVDTAAPADPAPDAAPGAATPPDDAPAAPAAAPPPASGDASAPTPGRWYKAKPW
jgi:hypothetical protein